MHLGNLKRMVAETACLFVVVALEIAYWNKGREHRDREMLHGKRSLRAAMEHAISRTEKDGFHGCYGCVDCTV